MEMVDFQGKTDPLILIESLRMMGFSEDDIRNKSEDLKEKYFSYLEEEIYDNKVEIMPGVLEIIPKLYNDDEIILGLLTGNFQTSGRIKLKRHDLNKFFNFGVFGDDAHLRNDMPPIAQKRIAELHNINIDFSDIIIIGDTVYDIECARHSGAVSLAVGTGWADKKILLDKEPDYYLDNLGDVEQVMSIIKSDAITD